MSKLTKADLLPYDQYTKLHEKFLKEVIAEKKTRRVNISDRMTGLFESKLTVFYQIQEMIRAEQITDEEYIDDMLEVYNDLLPEENEVSMTLFIEVLNQQELRSFNKTIVGIENCVELVFDEYKITSYEPGSEDDEHDDKYTQSVHYLHFSFDENSKKAFLSPDVNVILRVNHPNYKVEVTLSAELIEELQKQLRSLWYTS